MTKKERTEQILAAALKQAGIRGYMRVTRDDIAFEAGVATGLVSLYMGTMADLRRTVMRHAVIQEVLSIVAEGLADRNPHAIAAPFELKERALQTLV